MDRVIRCCWRTYLSRAARDEVFRCRFIAFPKSPRKCLRKCLGEVIMGLVDIKHSVSLNENRDPR